MEPMRPHVRWNRSQQLWQVTSQYGLHHFHHLEDAEAFAEWASEPRRGSGPILYPLSEESA